MKQQKTIIIIVLFYFMFNFYERNLRLVANFVDQDDFKLGQQTRFQFFKTTTSVLKQSNKLLQNFNSFQFNYGLLIGMYR